MKRAYYKLERADDGNDFSNTRWNMKSFLSDVLPETSKRVKFVPVFYSQAEQE